MRDSHESRVLRARLLLASVMVVLVVSCVSTGGGPGPTKVRHLHRTTLQAARHFDRAKDRIAAVQAELEMQGDVDDSLDLNTAIDDIDEGMHLMRMLVTDVYPGITSDRGVLYQISDILLTIALLAAAAVALLVVLSIWRVYRGKRERASH